MTLQSANIDAKIWNKCYHARTDPGDRLHLRPSRPPHPNLHHATTDNRERYTWSGWTLLTREIYTGTSPTSSFRYTWGLDLSETLEGAGGVGGLLAIERSTVANTTWDIRFPHYDANGNIIALTDSTGNLSARYRYDAFGKTLSTEDTDYSGWVTHNIHGFSTKPTLGTPALLYYGYRFYTPSLGRWINRDPVEEKGGVNLYGFVGNSGISKFDLLGRQFDIHCRPAGPGDIDIDGDGFVGNCFNVEPPFLGMPPMLPFPEPPSRRIPDTPSSIECCEDEAWYVASTFILAAASCSPPLILQPAGPFLCAGAVAAYKAALIAFENCEPHPDCCLDR